MQLHQLRYMLHNYLYDIRQIYRVNHCPYIDAASTEQYTSPCPLSSIFNITIVNISVFCHWLLCSFVHFVFIDIHCINDAKSVAEIN